MIARAALLAASAFVLGSAVPRPLPPACPAFFLGQQAPVGGSKDARQAVLVCHSGYAALVSLRTRDPVWSAEHLTPASIGAAHRLRRKGTFHYAPELPQSSRAELADCLRTGWDRGHMAPDGDMPTRQAQQESFALGNVVPQAARLNRVAWVRIERKVRTMARLADVYVLTGPAFAGPPRGLGPDHVLIPAFTWKVAFSPGRPSGIGWLCTNVQASVCSETTVGTIKHLSRLDLFPTEPPSWAGRRLRVPK